MSSESGENTGRMSEISSVARSSIDIAELRARLRAMSDAELRRFGSAARHMCSTLRSRRPEDLARVEFEIQLEEASAEWRRRHPPKKGS